MCLLECYVELEQFAEAGALLGRLEQGDNPELLERARQMLLDAGMTLTSPSGDAIAQRNEERVEQSEEASVLSELSFSAEPAFDLNDGQNSESEPEFEVTWVDPAQANDERPLEGYATEDSALAGYSLEEEFSAAESTPIDIDPVDVDEEAPMLGAELSPLDSPLEPEEVDAEPEASLPSLGDEQGLQLAPLEEAVDDSALEACADSGKLEDGLPSAAVGPNTSGLALTPLDDDVDAAEAPATDNVDMDESIYGVETNPVDSKLDLARAYLDMGDEDGARPVLMEVIKEGDLAQQAEARELLLRLEAS
jgi:pilus assembly protein FimV